MSDLADPPLDSALAAVIEAIQELPELQVPSPLRHPHPLFEAVRTRFQGATPDSQKLVRPVWDVRRRQEADPRRWEEQGRLRREQAEREGLGGSGKARR